jgi:hypothetical protein
VHECSKTQLNFSPCSTLDLTFSTSKRLLIKRTSRERTSGHCLGTFVAVNLNPNLSPFPDKRSAYSYHNTLPSVSLFSFKELECDKTDRTNFHSSPSLFLKLTALKQWSAVYYGNLIRRKTFSLAFVLLNTAMAPSEGHLNFQAPSKEILDNIFKRSLILVLGILFKEM